MRVIVGFRHVALGLGLSALLTGCAGSDVTRAFGLQRNVPDEYTVTTRAPLSMPPSTELVKPGSGIDHTRDESQRMEALETLSPDVALHGTSGPDSSGQTMLINEADDAAEQADQGELGKAGEGYVDALLFWKGGGAGSVVDGDAENRRLKANAALGNPPTKGATPTKKAKKSKVLGVL
ncbi:DUF3035 domain-containing protein [Acetobacter sicerae]|uniref:DUF3035 domain-containing protein n=1 Tax=Acetobacter sicerae TaxID=85325 RepID=A0ABS8VWR5_9PROT|nr:DUF3035 domain-containing protein [Acetobacter sicerae]MCE0744513.1 DUF3035 domain-containing protein [Acetobacter sicerae]NHN90621.1 DUF3035 domain-containing protein [Acetobacter sicerae]